MKPMTVSFLKILSISYNFDLLIIFRQNYGGRKWKVPDYSRLFPIVPDYSRLGLIFTIKKSSFFEEYLIKYIIFALVNNKTLI